MKNMFNTAHSLIGVRLDNWLRLLWRNDFKIGKNRIPQTLYITLMSIAMFPLALIEALVYWLPIKNTKIKSGPVFVVGHWRSGTTYLQNLMSKDRRFAWFDPVSTTNFPNCMLLRPILEKIYVSQLKKARPFDNVQYQLDLPMEEVFAQNTLMPYGITQIVVFPHNYEEYISGAFISDLTPRQRKEWYRTYDYILRKMTYIGRGKPLLLKSPDNTCRMWELKQQYPGAKFVNIYRNPYTVIMSTKNMFIKQTELHSLQEMPENFDEILEDVVVGIFERMYKDLFEYQEKLPAEDYAEVCYETFVQDPETELRRIYEELELPGFDEALSSMRDHITSQADYKKNKFTLDDRLRKKINSRLGFYFEHYGYTMED